MKLQNTRCRVQGERRAQDPAQCLEEKVELYWLAEVFCDFIRDKRFYLVFFKLWPGNYNRDWRSIRI